MNEKNTTTAIAEYSPTAAALADIAKRMAKVVYDVSTPAGLAAAKKDRKEVRDLRVALEAKRVEIKEPALTRCREIDTEAARIKAELLKYETPPDEAIKAEEKRIEDERLAKVKAEEERMRKIQERITELRGNQNLTPMSGSKLIAEHISDLENILVDDSFGDLKDTAIAARVEGLARLRALLTTAIANEDEAKRLVVERAELDRQRAEQAERDRIARETRDAEAAAETERLRKERAAFEAEQAEAREKERVRQAGIDAENARIAAVNRVAQDAIDEANRELEARQQAERDAQAKREREENEARESAERKAAAEREAAERANFRPEFEAIVHVLCTTYGVTAAKVREWIQPAKAERKAA